MAWTSDGAHLFVGSHGGDISVVRDIDSILNTHDFSADRCRPLRNGIGKGGSTCDMKLTQDEKRLLICSHDCSLSLVSIEDQQVLQLDSTGDYDHWYTCAAVSNPLGCILASDNRGNVSVFDARLPGVIQRHSLHKSSKIGCIDIHSKGTIFATASNDRSCRVFDLRKIENPNSTSRNELGLYIHGGVVSSAYFSPQVPSRLLTTAQNDEIRVFDTSVAGEFAPPKFVIPHSHKFYQHITIIKAVWHPLNRDLIAIGRYDQPRGVDLISLSNGCQSEVFVRNLNSNIASTIFCVNAFSPNGKYLASATANNIVLWRNEQRNSHSSQSCDMKERISMIIAAQVRRIEEFSRGSKDPLRDRPSRADELDFSAFEFKRHKPK